MPRRPGHARARSEAGEDDGGEVVYGFVAGLYPAGFPSLPDEDAG
jgi:hypothetical protein